MPAGRPPKPTRLKILAGNPGKRQLNAREPQPRRGRPGCPSWLDAEAKAKWAAVVPELDRLGVLTIVDGDVLAAYCQAWAEFKLATETLRKEGRIISVGGTPVEEEKIEGKKTVKTHRVVGAQLQPHPAVAQQRSAWQHMKAFSALLGLDPSSRSKLSVTGAGSGQVDEFETFLSSSG